MVVAAAVAALLAVAPMQTAPQDPGQTPARPSEAVDLGDIEVTGRPLDDMIRSFVGEVAEPNRRRGLARWEDRICVGVANLRADAAQFVVDRISTIAEDVGLEPGAPGCTPNILIVATDDGTALARTLVEERRRAFRMGGSGMDRGGTALRDFVETDRPVRWWQMAVPIDSATGMRAIRIPGECNNACTEVADFAPQISVQAPSRLRTQIVDRLSRSIVIVDIDEVAGLSALQLADYIAMVTLAQIDPHADTRGYASILNVFHEPDSVDQLMDWDIAYLNGLYASEGNAVSRLSNRQEIVSAIHRAHSDLRAAETASD